jgi:hypothetical protein
MATAIREFIGSLGKAKPTANAPSAGDGPTGADTAPKATTEAAPGPTMKPGPIDPGGDASRAGETGEKPGMTAEKIKFDKERADVGKLRTELGKHQQAAHVSDKTGQADAALTAADSDAAKPDWKKAMAELASAKKACEDGTGFADKFASFLIKKAEANLVLTAATTSGWKFDASIPAALTSADTKAAPPTRNYAGAAKDLDSIITGLAPSFKKFYVDDVKPKIEALKKLPGAKFITDEIAELGKLMSQQEAGITAKQWRVVRLNATLIADKLLVATKIATRRSGFDAERPKADNAVKALQAHGAAVAAPLAQIQQRLTDADALATKADMQFEDATNQVKAIIKDCDDFGKLATDAQAYTKARGALADDLATLRMHPAAEKIKAELDVVSGLLDEAAKAAGDTGAPGTALVLNVDPTKHDLTNAITKLAQAKANLATAHKQADSLKGVATAEGALQGTPALAELQKSADSLAKEFAAAKKDKHADLAKAELDAVKTALDEAKAKIDAKDAGAATQALKTVTEKLTAARRMEVEHATFSERHAALTKRLDALKADKNQAKIKAKIDALDKALTDAAAVEKAEPAKAMAALDTAETAAAGADAALVARRAFDKEADAVEADLGKPAYASIRAEQTTELTKARDLADAFDFAKAEAAVKAIQNKIGAAEADGMARKTPPDPKLAEKVKKLVDAGATKELDDLIQGLPNTVDKQVFLDLAAARFKVKIEAQADGNEQVSIKRMCELMKDIPEDVLNNNPSLKKISRRVTEADGKTAGAYYVASTGQVVMNSRPKEKPKLDFEPGVTGRLPDREPDCVPANDKKEDLFDFNMLHELAHSIDDAKNYMGQNGHKPDHGGWIQHGGDIKPIVEAVIKETGFGTTDAERQYITDCILRNPAVPPTTFTGDKAKFDAFIKAAQTEGVWSNQALSEAATMDKRVYQEAYANTWVSYNAEARKRGITGYQFRAPGEWFSELYAAWKLGKLQPTHPAVAWLSKLKV